MPYSGPDIVLIDKPTNITSFDVIRRLRTKLGVRKMGHAGTLDPLASGLMIIGIESGTKKLNDYLKLPKTYEAIIRVGESRTTGDLEGEVIEEKEVNALDEARVREILEGMTGTLALAVPAYSAIKQGGVPLYKKARQGKEIDLPIKDMTITRAELSSISCADGRCDCAVTFDVASGTYIRSLAEEFGRRLGYPATLAGLRRTVIGNFKIEDAEKII